MNLRHVRAFITVAKKHSFVAASEALNISQPALSHCIRQLESRLGGQLLQRTTRRVRLTPVGEKFLPHAQHLVTQFDTVMSDIEDLLLRRRGHVVAACLASIAFRLMPVVMAKMKATYPGIAVGIRDENNHGAIESVLSGKADFAIASQTQPSPDLRAAPLASDDFRLVCRADHPLARRKIVRWKDVQRYPVILMGEDTGIRHLLNPILLQHDIYLDVVAEASHLSTVNGLVEEGIGVTLLAGLMLPREDKGLLVHRSLEPPIINRTIHILWRNGTRISPAAQALIETITAVLVDPQALNKWPHVEWHAKSWTKETFSGWIC
ncbi:LysR family transcriptional regulator [Shumkonia mesophila]|uniref:LysR family transcriptional regulator n=1 Tax=Shumkonia mesophila TaxID=2838854 RepID=UPI002934A1B4|nr:LysR substrate-binding domain-containing protein [Shumkonia mesophila]